MARERVSTLRAVEIECAADGGCGAAAIDGDVDACAWARHVDGWFDVNGHFVVTASTEVRKGSSDVRYRARCLSRSADDHWSP